MMVYTAGHFIIVDEAKARERYNQAVKARDTLLSLVDELQGTCQHMQRAIRSGVNIAPLIHQARHQLDQININQH